MRPQKMTVKKIAIVLNPNIKRLKTFFVLTVLLMILGSAGAQDTVRKCTKNDIKITLLSLGSGSTRITYERAFTPIHSAELTVGVIGLGWDWIHHLHSRGVVMKAAYKWRIIPQKNSQSWLDGFYLKPELIAAIFNYQDKEKRLNKHEEMLKTRQFALLGECGYQLVLRWFLFDVYAGMGGAFGTGNQYNYYHGFMHLPKNTPLAFTAGFRIGVAF